MKQSFDTSELKTELERSLGFALRSLDRRGGASALNFRAVRASDGLTFLVKCSPFARQAFFDGLIDHFRVLSETKAVCRLFERECPPTFRGCNVICQSWCGGEAVFPDKLSTTELDGFVHDYLGFSAAMQRSLVVLPARPIRQWREDALGKCRGIGGWLLRRILQEMEPTARDYEPDRLQVIHGDFHHGNFRFVSGKVSGFFDLEEFRQGYPADDLIRYFTCAAEHLRWYEQRRKRRMLEQFAHVVRRLPWTRREWLTAINGRFVGKVYMRTRNFDRVSLAKALNLLWCVGFYRRLRQVVDAGLSQSGDVT